MQRQIEVTAFLQKPDGTPDGVFEESYRADFSGVPPTKMAEAGKAAMLQLSAQFNNGLVREIGPEEIEIIPINRVRSITLKLSPVTLANAADIAAVTGAST